MGSHRSDNRATASLANILWIIVLACWITLLFFLCGLLLEGRVSVPVRILVAFAGSLAGIVTSAVFLNNSPRIRTCRKQASQLHSFCKAIKQAAATLELQEILDSAAKVIVEVTGVRGCSIELLDAKTGKMKARTIVGLDKELSDDALNIVESLYRQGSATSESVIVRDILMRDFPAVDEEFESLICVPLRLEERPLGAICIFGERGQRLSPEMISLLSSLGDVVSLAIAHALVYEDLKTLVQTKTKFMFQASHELRSPLNTIQSMARTLLEGHVGKLTAKQQDMLARIDLRAQMLSDIVGDLLILAAGRAGLSTVKHAPVDLRELVHDQVSFFETKAREKRIELKLHNRVRDGIISGNRDGLASIVTNLLSNATKYTSSGGKVTVRLFESKEELVLEISDTGIGIPKEEQDGLFTEFFRASNAKMVAKAGTGLGLAIVKATVEQHGGAIDVESEQGKGTTFRIFFNKAAKPGLLER